MALINRAGKEVSAKLVYYGPGLSGKTTNLELLFKKVPEDSRGKMISMKTRSDRTLFFDLLPLNADPILDYSVRILLYTVPGQVYYNATRRLVLKGVDAVVFVADSQRDKMEENVESLENLRTNLTEMGIRLEDLPWVIQYNKRDLPGIHSVEELDARLNTLGVPSFEASAKSGEGVHETLSAVSKLVRTKLEALIQDEKGAQPASPTPDGAGAPEASSPVTPPESPLPDRKPEVPLVSTSRSDSRPDAQPQVEASSLADSTSSEPVHDPDADDGAWVTPSMSDTLKEEFDEGPGVLDLDAMPDPLVVEMPLTRSRQSGSSGTFRPDPPPGIDQPVQTPPEAMPRSAAEQGGPSLKLDSSSLSRDSATSPGETRAESSQGELLLRVPRSMLASGELRIRILLEDEAKSSHEPLGELVAGD